MRRGSVVGGAAFEASDWLRTTRCEWAPLYSLLLYSLPSRRRHGRKKGFRRPLPPALFLNSWILGREGKTLDCRPQLFAYFSYLYVASAHSRTINFAPSVVGRSSSGRAPSYSCRSFGRSLFALVSFVCSVLDPSCLPRPPERSLTAMIKNPALSSASSSCVDEDGSGGGGVFFARGRTLF